jgi:hypothetical protein
VAKIKTEHQRGDLSKTIRVRSSSVENSNLLLLCGASMGTAFQISPVSGVDFGQVKVGDGAEQELTISDRAGGALPIRSIETGSKYVQVHVGEGTSFKVKVLASAPMGPLDGRLKIRTGLPEKPFFLIPYRGVVVGPVSYTPQVILIPTDQVGATSSVTLEATVYGKFDIRNLTVPDGFTVIGGVQLQGQRYLVSVTISDPARIPERPRLIIETDREEEPVISVPIRVENRRYAPETGKAAK